MTTHPVLATDATLAHLNQFFDTWCNADDVTSIVQRIPVVKTLHDKEMTTTVSGGWYVAPRNVVMNIGKTRDDSETLTELSREVSGLARAISLSVLRSVAINAQTTSSVFTPSDVASSNTFAVEESMDHNANHVTRGDSPPPPARTNSLDRTMGPDDMRPPASPVPSARRPRNSSLAFANASLVGSPKDSSASDKSRRDMARALADMTALYLNAIQRQWTLERQLLLQEAELNETKEALDAYKNAESLHLPSGQLTSSHSVGSLNNAPHVAVVAARAKLFATQRDRACLSPDSAVRSNIQTTVASPVQLALGRSGGSGSATNFGEMPSFASMGGFTRHPQHHTAKAVVSAQAEADGSTTLNQYIILAEVGAGSQGKVLLAVDTECGETRAIKEIPRPRIQGPGIRSRMDNARLLSQLQREIAIMKRCRHKNVVALFEVIDDPDAANLYLVMQYVEHGPVARLSHDGHTKPIEPLKLASFARQLCAGLHYLHGRRVVHKDIKPENILLGANDTVFLADFGISSFDEEADEPQPFTLVTAPSVGMSGGGSASASMSGAFDPGRDAHVQHGTLVFRAPELLSGDGHSRFEPADVWALGLSLYVMLYGSLPWPLTSAYQYMQDVLNVDVKFPTTIVPYSPSPIGSPSKANSDQSSGDELPCASLWTELLSGMLRRDPGARLTAQQAHAKAKELHRLAEEIETSRLGVSTLSDQDIKQAFTTRRLVHPMPTPTPSA